MKLATLLGAAAGVLLLTGTAAPAAAHPAPATPPSCCLCVIAYPPGGGDPLIGCGCTSSSGGIECIISASGCRTPGVCTGGGSGGLGMSSGLLDH